MFPKKVREMTRARTLRAMLVKAKVTTWVISWMVSGWRESRVEVRKERKLMVKDRRGK